MDAEERQLSDRERTVLLLAAEGLTDKEIAKHLNLSQRTIGTYWERMRQKLGPFSRTQIVARFLRLEAEIERSNENYRNLFGAWDEGIWILTPAGKTIYANQATASLLGAKLDEVIHGDCSEILGRVLGDSAADFLSDSAKQGASREGILQQTEGIRWIGFSGSPVSDRRGQVAAIVLIARDITLQKKVKLTLQSCTDGLDFISKHSTDLIVRITSDMRVAFANEPFVHALDQRNVVGSSVIDNPLFRPSETWERGVREALEQGQSTILVELPGIAGTVEAHLCQEPSPELQPASVLGLIARTQI